MDIPIYNQKKINAGQLHNELVAVLGDNFRGIGVWHGEKVVLTVLENLSPAELSTANSVLDAHVPQPIWLMQLTPERITRPDVATLTIETDAPDATCPITIDDVPYVVQMEHGRGELELGAEEARTLCIQGCGKTLWLEVR